MRMKLVWRIGGEMWCAFGVVFLYKGVVAGSLSDGWEWEDFKWWRVGACPAVGAAAGPAGQVGSGGARPTCGPGCCFGRGSRRWWEIPCRARHG
jgi:hypothetical protein